MIGLGAAAVGLVAPSACSSAGSGQVADAPGQVAAASGQVAGSGQGTPSGRAGSATPGGASGAGSAAAQVPPSAAGSPSAPVRAAEVLGGPVACRSQGGTAPVAVPRHVRTIATGQTGWFSSPGLVDLTGDRKLEIVAPDYSTFVFDASGRRLGTGTATADRVFAPAVVADLDGDGVKEIVVGGQQGTIAAYEMRGGTLRVKAGWPASTRSGGQAPETRGLAAADLDGDGRLEVVATTTNTSDSGSQVFVFTAAGKLFQPKGVAFPAWPRYNARTGTGGDAGFNGEGNHGYGAYGENVGIGNLDDDPQPEIVVTFDNHQINVFNADGTSVLASPWYTNPQNAFLGRRMGWGQFIRWYDPAVEDRHYHAHSGAWPDVKQTMWLQWTASPPAVADLDRDGRNEVIGFPNAELHEPYQTQGYPLVVLDGAYGNGSRSARRHPGFVTPPMSAKPAVRPDGDWYPPTSIPAPTVVQLSGDPRPEIVSALPDGYVYAYSPDGKRLWRYDYAHGATRTFASEVSAADLNRDGVPELVFGVYSNRPGGGRLVVLSASGSKLFELKPSVQGNDPNGIGIPAAPSIADLDGDGRLEIVTSSFDHGLDVWTVPGSGTACLPWPTGRANLQRTGSPGSGALS